MEAATTTAFEVSVSAAAQHSSEVHVGKMEIEQHLQLEKTTTSTTTKTITTKIATATATTTTILLTNEEKEEGDSVNNNKRIVYPKASRQVAGNSHKHARTGRVDAFGHFYKPTDDTRKGMTELQFYENWRVAEQERVPEFSPFLATFVSRTELYESHDAAKPMPFLKLRDVTAEMKQANVVDIKIGERTWHPSHDAEYREKRHRGDLETTSSSIGFRVCGMLTYEEESKTERYWNRKWAKALNLETTMSGLDMFFGQDSERIANVVQKLKDIRKSLETNPFPVYFLGSSILLCYDSSDLHSDVRVVVVDFCNAVKNESREVDRNFLDGLISLTNIIETIGDHIKSDPMSLSSSSSGSSTAGIFNPITASPSCSN